MHSILSCIQATDTLDIDSRNLPQGLKEEIPLLSSEVAVYGSPYEYAIE